MAVLARLLRHWELKLLSVIFAVGLWLFVATEDRGTELYTVPLDIVDVPPGLQVTEIGPETVDVRVEGRRSVLSRLPPSDLRARIALKDAGPGELTVPVQPQNVAAPRSVNVVRVMPAYVRLTLEPVTRARVEVTPRVVGRPAPGFRVARVDVEPRQVEIRVTGWNARFPPAIETAPIDIEGARETVRREVLLAAPPGAALVEGPERAAVTVEVTPQ
jgi:YbbR domain-containing protein